MTTSVELQMKFRSRGLQPEDREPLLECIEGETAPIRLAALLYMWGQSFPEHPSVRLVCSQHIEEPKPGLTSTCLKLVCDYWDHWREYERTLAHYLDPAIYDEWYDEVIVAFSYVTRHPYGWSRETLARYANVEREAERLGLTDFR